MDRGYLHTTVVGCLLALGCGTGDVTRPPTNPGSCQRNCDNLPPRPTGPGGVAVRGGPISPVSDGGTVDAGTTAMRTVQGSLRIFNVLPPRMASVTGASGWRARVLPALGEDAGVEMPIEATTSAAGTFTLSGAITVSESVSGLGRSFMVEMVQSSDGNVGALFEVPEGSTMVTFETYSDDALRTALNSAGQIQSDDRALVAVMVRESRAPGARPVANVIINVDGQASATLYDGPADLMEVNETGTGVRGFAIVPNVPVAASGDGTARISGPRLARPVTVRVRRARTTWILLTAS